MSFFLYEYKIFKKCKNTQLQSAPETAVMRDGIYFNLKIFTAVAREAKY
jgi:hypothetical protein